MVVLSAYWSTCAFLINLDVMRPIVKAILTKQHGGWMDVKLIAGVARHGHGPAIPRYSPCERKGGSILILSF